MGRPDFTKITPNGKPFDYVDPSVEEKVKEIEELKLSNKKLEKENKKLTKDNESLNTLITQMQSK